MIKLRLLWLILLVALVLRLGFALAQDPHAPFTTGSADSGWYLDNAYALVTGNSPPGINTNVSNLASPPLYFIVIGVPQMLFSRIDAVIAVRVLQALLSTITCYFAYRLALRLTGRDAAGLLAAAALAVSPAFIIEAAQILTETVFIFLLTGGVWLYVEYIADTGVTVGARYIVPLQRNPLWLLVLAAVLLGLATLTRAVLLAFPFGLALHLILARGWRKGWRHAALLLLVYALTVSTWTIYSVARWNRWVIAGEGLAFLYLGATDSGWTSPQEVDQALAEQSPNGNYTEAAQSIIGSDPLGWIKHRVTELAEAYLQPHGTTFFPGASLRELALGVLGGKVSLADLVQGDAFWSKLALYLFHYVGLLAGLVGMWQYRRRWRVALPMLGLIAYLTLVHLALYVVPRYLFPAEIFWWVFAAAALQPLLASLTRRTG